MKAQNKFLVHEKFIKNKFRLVGKCWGKETTWETQA